MAWKIRMMSGKDYIVEKRDADNASNAMMSGGIAVIMNGNVRITGKSIEAIEDEIAGNLIVQDENFKKWITTGDGKHIDVLNNRYSGDKYDKEWEQALEYKKRIESGEIKLLE